MTTLRDSCRGRVVKDTVTPTPQMPEALAAAERLPAIDRDMLVVVVDVGRAVAAALQKKVAV